MTQTLEQPSIDRVSHPRAYDETVIVSAGAPIVLWAWRGDPGAPTVVFLPGTMTHPLFYAEFLDGLGRRGLSVVGVHYQGHGHSPRVGSRLGWANLVANAADAVDWAAAHLDGPVVLLGSSQGGVLAMAVAARSRRLALVVAHNLVDPSLPESLTVSRLPRRLMGGCRPLLATLRLAARIAPGLPVPFWAYLGTWIGWPGRAPGAVRDRSEGGANVDREVHRSGRAGWLRAAVLGANDGIVSTASLVIGVAAAAASRNAVLLAGVAGLVAGATSMAAGEYVSVSSQRDAERADIARERRELAAHPEFEQAELTEVYVKRGLDRALAATVAERLMAVDPLGSHVRDELGLQPGGLARPLQAAVVSAVSFAVGAALPLGLIVLAPIGIRVRVTALAALVLLALLGAAGARLGGAPAGRAALRVTVGGALAMGLTALIGQLVGTTGL